MRRGNLLAALPQRKAEEQVDLLVEGAGVRIERIVSTGRASPPAFWYDQPDDEFVVLLTGAARLRFEEGDVTVDMKPGDWIEIPARVLHRVESTQAEPATVWLAVHTSHGLPDRAPLARS
ncbi:MAG: cupin domain-containing protein [Rhodospirillales bacterium]|nr:cupin domain-containing protein [Rhodospirillales bacterium]